MNRVGIAKESLISSLSDEQWIDLCILLDYDMPQVRSDKEDILTDIIFIGRKENES
jgi:hypothetical protein